MIEMCIRDRDGIVSPKPMAPVYTRPFIFLCTHLSDKVPPIITPMNEDSAMVIVDMGPACDIGIFRFSANKVGNQFLALIT